jgi:aldehyde:ferredoxin oxidoreductase
MTKCSNTLRNITTIIRLLELISTRNINENNILEFQMLLSGEQWDNISGNNNVNNMFNNFHTTCLRCFNACFPKKEIKYNNNNKSGSQPQAQEKENFYYYAEIIGILI